MHILSIELLSGPAPTQDDVKEHARYGLRRSRVMDLHQRMLTAHYIRTARTHGLSNREIGEILGHTEGWVRQYHKDTAGKTDPNEFADAGFRGHFQEHNQFFKDMAAASGLDQQLHLCAERGLSDAAVASALSIPLGRVPGLMEGPRAEAAA